MAKIWKIEPLPACGFLGTFGMVPPALLLGILTLGLTGCRAYTESTPWRFLEGGPEAHYKRIFRKPIPADVQVVHSVVVVYGWRPGVITTDDYEFELVVSDRWIQEHTRSLYLKQNDSEFFKKELAHRKARASKWYAPEPLDRYILYRDISERGFVHMLVQKGSLGDGRHRVFVSKH